MWQGESSEKFLKRAKHVHLVDSWSPLYTKNQMNMETMKHIWIDIPLVKRSRRFCKILQSYLRKCKSKIPGFPVTIHRMSAAEWFDTFAEPFRLDIR